MSFQSKKKKSDGSKSSIKSIFAEYGQNCENLEGKQQDLFENVEMPYIETCVWQNQRQEPSKILTELMKDESAKKQTLPSKVKQYSQSLNLLKKKDKVSLQKTKSKTNIRQKVVVQNCKMQQNPKTPVSNSRSIQQISDMISYQNQLYYNSNGSQADLFHVSKKNYQPSFEKLAKRLKSIDLIKVQQINQASYAQLGSNVYSAINDLNKYLEVNPNSVRQKIPVQQIIELTSKVKKNLNICEEKVALRKILSKEVELLKIQCLNSKESLHSQKQILLATSLNQQADCFFDTGKYPQAIKTYKQSTDVLEKNFSKHRNLITESNVSYFSQFKAMFFSAENKQTKEQIQMQLKQSQINLKNAFELLVASLNSLAKCYDVVIDVKQKKSVIKKAQKYIENYQKIEKSSNQSSSPQQISIQIQKAKINFLINQNSYKKCQQIIQKFESFLQTNLFPEQAFEIHQILININESQLDSSMKFESSSFETSDMSQNNIIIDDLAFKKGKSFDYEVYRAKIAQCKKYYQNLIEIIKKMPNKNCFDEFKQRNLYGEFLYKYSDYQEALQQAGEVLGNPVSHIHTTGSSAYLVVGKVSSDRGNYHHSFESLNKSYEILKKALLKEKMSSNKQKQNVSQNLSENAIDEKANKDVLLRSQIYKEIQLMRIKIYNKQMRHDLALKTLQFLTPKQGSQDQKNYFLADIYEEKGNTKALKSPDNIQLYLKDFQKAIGIRSQSNPNCIQNAFSYCSIIKYIISSNKKPIQMDQAKTYLDKAKQIFARYPSNHPNNWVIFLILAQISINQGKLNHNKSQSLANKKKSQNFNNHALELVLAKHGPEHINTYKVRLHLIISLESDQKDKLLQSLEEDLKNSIKKEKSQIKELAQKQNPTKELGKQQNQTKQLGQKQNQIKELRQKQNQKKLLIDDQKDYILEILMKFKNQLIKKQPYAYFKKQMQSDSNAPSEALKYENQSQLSQKHQKTPSKQQQHQFMMTGEIATPYEACSSQKINDSQSENSHKMGEQNFELSALKKLFEHKQQLSEVSI